MSDPPPEATILTYHKLVLISLSFSCHSWKTLLIILNCTEETEGWHAPLQSPFNFELVLYKRKCGES